MKYSVVVFSSVIKIKVPDNLRKRMRRAKVNWSEEIKKWKFIAQRVEEERKENPELALKVLTGGKSVEKGFSAASVREDRDSG